MRICVVGEGQREDLARAREAVARGAEVILLDSATALAGIELPMGVRAVALEEAGGASEAPLATAGLPDLHRSGQALVALRALHRELPLDEIHVAAARATGWQTLHEARTGGLLSAARVRVELAAGDRALAAPLGEEACIDAIQRRDAARFCLQMADEVAGDREARDALEAAGWTMGSARPLPAWERGERKRVCAIIPHFDSRHLGETLEHLFAQSAPLEIVIVDDQSPPEGLARAEALVRAHPAVRLHVLEENIGQAAARNFAVRNLTDAELVLFVDADNNMRPRMVERLVEALRVCPGAAWAQSGIHAFDEESGETVFRATPHPHEFSPAPLLLSNTGGDVCSLHFRDAFLAAGGFPEQRWGAEDWGLWIRLACSGRRGVLVPEALFDYRYRKTSQWVLRTAGSRLRQSAYAVRTNLALAASAGEELEVAAGLHFGGLIDAWRAKAEALGGQEASARAEASAAREELQSSRAQTEALHAEVSRLKAQLAHEVEARSREVEAREIEARSREELLAAQAELRSALEKMASSSAVRAARLLSSASPRLHEALGKALRRALAAGERLSKLAERARGRSQ